MKIQFNNRIEEELVKTLEALAKKETEKQGYRVTRTDMLEKAIRLFIKNYK